MLKDIFEGDFLCFMKRNKSEKLLRIVTRQ